MTGYFGTTVTQQTITFLYAVALGILLCAVYDVFRIIRIAFGARHIAVFVEDLIFSLIALILTFVFVITFNNGEVRFFVLIGELLGFTIYYFTVGRAVMKLSKAIINLIKKLFRFVFTPFAKLFKAVKNKIKAKKEKTVKKRRYIFKKHLKIDKQM